MRTGDEATVQQHQSHKQHKNCVARSTEALSTGHKKRGRMNNNEASIEQGDEAPPRKRPTLEEDDARHAKEPKGTPGTAEKQDIDPLLKSPPLNCQKEQEEEVMDPGSKDVTMVDSAVVKDDGKGVLAPKAATWPQKRSPVEVPATIAFNSKKYKSDQDSRSDGWTDNSSVSWGRDTESPVACDKTAGSASAPDKKGDDSKEEEEEEVQHDGEWMRQGNEKPWLASIEGKARKNSKTMCVVTVLNNDKKLVAKDLKVLRKTLRNVEEQLASLVSKGEPELKQDDANRDNKQVEAKASREAEVDREVNQDAKPKAEPTTKPKAKPEAEPEAEPEAKPEAEPDANPDAKPKAEPEAEPDAKPDAKPKAKPEAEPEAEPDAKPKARPEAKPNAVPEAEPEAKPKAEPEAEPDAKPKAKPEAAPDAKPKAIPQADKPKAEPEAEPDAKPKAKLEAEPDAKPKAIPEADQPKAEAEAEPDAKPKAVPEAEPDAKPKAKPEAEPDAKPKAKPQAEHRDIEADVKVTDVKTDMNQNVEQDVVDHEVNLGDVDQDREATQEEKIRGLRRKAELLRTEIERQVGHQTLVRWRIKNRKIKKAAPHWSQLWETSTGPPNLEEYIYPTSVKRLPKVYSDGRRWWTCDT